jgi:indole-3-glycerol phosphate synthase
LGRLTTQARERTVALGPVGDWKRRAADAGPVPDFRSALGAGTVAVIAELKRRSPSKGSFNDSIDAATRARLYEAGGASALSVLTEPSEFGGSVEDLLAARGVVSCPLLRKDFHIEPVQMFEARCFGASAALLIVRALGPDQTRILADAAREAGVEPVFEVRDEAELSIATDAGASVIGVNRRNLETLVMETDVLERLLPMIPAACVAVAESGITSRADVEDAALLGADAVLVGSSLSTAPDPRATVAALCGVPRGRRRD